MRRHKSSTAAKYKCMWEEKNHFRSLCELLLDINKCCRAALLYSIGAVLYKYLQKLNSAVFKALKTPTDFYL